MNQDQPVSPEQAQGDKPEQHIHFSDLFKRFGTHAATVLLLIIGVIIAGVIVREKKITRELDASMSLWSVQSLEELKSIVEEFPSTEAAPRATLKLAKSYYDSGSYTLAMETYDDFLKKYPDHPMAISAKLGRIHCLEAQGRLSKAADEFQQLADKLGPEHYATPQALVGRGRCLHQMQQYNDARRIYENVIVKYDQSVWALRAEELLKIAKKEINEQSVQTNQSDPSDSPESEPDELYIE